ncbi:granzyme A-like [Hyperolius riggenbachi]|uniref:granzyme A-like n=1 Tax=Hyperolius riggenbachi TaxID=752182 RepID=UPI0035A2BE42
MKLLLLLSSACFLLCKGAEIIHGREATPHSRPYMALITFETQFEQKICGGSLIKDNWVLTAGHCQMPGAFIAVFLGSHSRGGNERLRQKFTVLRSIVHPNYNRSNLHNDLRLIKLRGKATLNKAVKLLPLPETFEDVNGESVCETAGWGKTEKLDAADHLLEVNVTILDREKCVAHWNEKKVLITQNMTCTSVGPSGQDTCTGDSGGPLICNGVFRGVTSFGPKVCGQDHESSVFTRLTKAYVKWISETIAKRS